MEQIKSSGGQPGGDGARFSERLRGTRDAPDETTSTKRMLLAGMLTKLEQTLTEQDNTSAATDLPALVASAATAATELTKMMSDAVSSTDNDIGAFQEAASYLDRRPQAPRLESQAHLPSAAAVERVIRLGLGLPPVDGTAARQWVGGASVEIGGHGEEERTAAASKLRDGGGGQDPEQRQLRDGTGSRSTTAALIDALVALMVSEIFKFQGNIYLRHVYSSLQPERVNALAGSLQPLEMLPLEELQLLERQGAEVGTEHSVVPCGEALVGR